MYMECEPDVMSWPLTSSSSFIQLSWHELGPVTWSGSSATFPAGPGRPGVYMVKVSLGNRYRVYIGETADLRKRLRSFGGRAEEKPNQRGKTTANMRGRIRRTCRAGGEAVVYLLELPVKHVPGRESLDLHCKDCRITLERLALATAYLRGEPLINEHGFPECRAGDPLL